MRLSIFLVASASLASTSAFTGVAPATTTATSGMRRHISNNNVMSHRGTTFPSPRGGGTAVDDASTTALSLGLDSVVPFVSSAVPMVTSALTEGPLWRGLAAMTAVAFSTLTPLTLLRQGYAFSVGYGFSMAAMAAVLLRTLGGTVDLADLTAAPPATLLACTTVAYGVRLALHLLVRDIRVPSRRKAMDKANRSAPLARIPFAASVSIFYAFLVSPVFYALRSSQGVSLPFVDVLTETMLTNLRRLELTGLGLAVFGFLLESVTDTQKYVVKSAYSGKGNTSTFVGPTSGFFKFCRHPNYLGELLFWSGLYLGGLPHYGTSAVAWATSTLGLYGIFGVMTGASKRLDKKQQQTYGGEPVYEKWRKSTVAMFPFS